MDINTLIHNIIYLYIPVMIIPLSIYKIYRLTHSMNRATKTNSHFLFPIR